MRCIRYFAVLALSLCAAHLAWSALMVGWINAYYDHRIFNLRHIEDKVRHWEDFTSAFVVEHLQQTRDGKPTLMFLGSSVSYGFPWQEEVIFSRLFAQNRPQWHVSNLSVIGSNMRSLTDFATCALGPGHRPDMLVVEVPLVNSTFTIRADSQHKPRTCKPAKERISGYWPLVLERPQGTGWFSILWDEMAYWKPDQDISVAPLPPNYFADSREFSETEALFVAELRRYLTAVSEMGEKVYAFVSPIHTAVITEAGGDRQSVEYQIALTHRICREFDRVTCLDATFLNEKRELFYNLTHLNQRGHRALADWLIGQIAH
jgi:hypothetical protein